MAIDPGRAKSGVVVADAAGGVLTILERGVVPTAGLAPLLREWGSRHAVTQVVVGDRTGGDALRRILVDALPGVPVEAVGEAHTTLLARRRYFADHPPRGWRRLLPRSMQLPPEPYDDYAAVVILERFLEGKRRPI